MEIDEKLDNNEVIITLTSENWLLHGEGMYVIYYYHINDPNRNEWRKALRKNVWNYDEK